MCLKYTTYALAATKKGEKKKGEKKTRILLANRKCKSASPLPSFIPTLKSLFFWWVNKINILKAHWSTQAIYKGSQENNKKKGQQKTTTPSRWT